MSDLMIKGMKIPKNCYDCQLNKGCDTRWFLEIDRRPDDCPIVDVPSAKPERETVIFIGDGYADGVMVYDQAKCPSCGHVFDEAYETWGANYCFNCGQALNWEVENEC